MIRLLNSLFFLFSLFPLFAQNTLGLISNQALQSFPGYNLIYPHNQSNVYLLDNCGQIVHSWEGQSDDQPGNTAYVLENGNLVKTKRNSNPNADPIWAGGGGAFVEIRNWENQLLHLFELNDSLFRLHHDIAPMPNGNILMIAWASKTYAEAVEAGRDTNLLAQKKLWSEVVLEWNPEGDSIVWEWHVWDHLVQDYDPQKANYGSVAGRPELINLNYDEHNGHPDWLHINAIDYNPVLDQIALSVPYFNELWIIDHSTTTEEATSHSGGNSDKGGDLLFRWGNPLAYEKGDSTYKKLFFQHDVHWVEPGATKGSPNYSRLALFNNRVGINLSTANVLNTGFDEESNAYSFDGIRYGPSGFERTASHPGSDIRSASAGLSSAQVLPNDNFLICSGRWGYTYELTPDDKIVWEYVTPISRGQKANQGDTLSITENLTFRLKRYPLDYAGFIGRDLSPKGYLELNPNVDFCNVLTSVSPTPDNDIKLFPNPVSKQLIVEGLHPGQYQIHVYDQWGRLVETFTGRGFQKIIDTSLWHNGLYFIRINEHPARKVVVGQRF